MSTAVATPAQTPASIRIESPERWQRASERAQLAGVTITPVDALGTYRVTSASKPGVSYETDGIHCTCDAAGHGDPICLHRAAVRDHLTAQQPRCAICSDSGVEYISIWAYKRGEAVTVSQMPCRCQTPEPEPPAPAVNTRLAIEEEICWIEAELARNYDTLHRLNGRLERDGRLNEREWAALDRAGNRDRELHERMRALTLALTAETVSVAA